MNERKYNATLHTEYFNSFMNLELDILEDKFSDARDKYVREPKSLVNKMEFLAVNDAIKEKQR